jgi:protein tyrosine phosphatase (PTP) superfamily phosphohydrolase (DUF442 family)
MSRFSKRKRAKFAGLALAASLLLTAGRSGAAENGTDSAEATAKQTKDLADELLSDSSNERPTHWGVRIEDYPGLPNLHKVDDGLYRGAQPTEAGFQQLKSLGIKTVVNLRSFHSDRKQCRRNQLEYEKIDVQAWEAEEEEVIEFLKLAIDPEKRPIFVHCHHGADRTGMMIACYRMAVQNWTREEALQEMREGGYNFHSIWSNIVRYINKVDIEKIRRRAGIPIPPEVREAEQAALQAKLREWNAAKASTGPRMTRPVGGKPLPPVSAEIFLSKQPLLEEAHAAIASTRAEPASAPSASVQPLPEAPFLVAPTETKTTSTTVLLTPTDAKTAPATQPAEPAKTKASSTVSAARPAPRKESPEEALAREDEELELWMNAQDFSPAEKAALREALRAEDESK